MKLFPGKDGIVRVAELKTAQGTIVRPVQKLYPLEVRQQKLATLECDKEHLVQKVTRTGRIINPPARYGD